MTPRTTVIIQKGVAIPALTNTRDETKATGHRENMKCMNRGGEGGECQVLREHTMTDPAGKETTMGFNKKKICGNMGEEETHVEINKMNAGEWE